MPKVITYGGDTKLQSASELLRRLRKRGREVCEECAETIIMDAFKELMLSERAKTVGIDLEKI